jgi:putative tricarboxylic transport membrane protein
MIKKYADVISGGFLMLFSAVIFFSSFGIKRLTVSKIGAAFVPQVTAVCLGLIGSIILIAGTKSLTKKAEESDKGGIPADGAVRVHSVLATLMVLILYIVLLEKIGFLIMTALYLFAQFYILTGKPERKIPVFIITAVVLSAGIFYLFAGAFQLTLPPGLLG